MSQIIPSNPAISQAVNQGLNATGTPLAAGAGYSAEISRRNPTAFVFLIDQSGSMSNTIQFNGKTMKLAEAAAIVINETLLNMVAACEKQNEVRHYFDVAVIGYGQSDQADFVWEGNLKGRDWVGSHELSDNYAFMLNKPTRTRKGEVKELSVPAWFSPIHANRTPMKSALKVAHKLLKDWIAAHPGAYPPTVMNITDGAATDATNEQLLKAAKQLRNLRTMDGNVLLFNCHLSSAGDSAVVFPVRKSDLPQDEYAQLLFDMSSDLPSRYNRQIAEWRNEDLQVYTAMMFNAEIADLFKLLDIGTRTALSQTQN